MWANLVANPSIEVDTWLWTAHTGAAISRDTARASHGAASLKATGAAAGDAASTLFVAPRGGVTFQARVFAATLPTTSGLTIRSSDGATQVAGTAVLGTAAAWQRLYGVVADGVLTPGAAYRLWWRFGGAGTVWLDEATVTIGATGDDRRTGAVDEVPYLVCEIAPTKHAADLATLMASTTHAGGTAAGWVDVSYRVRQATHRQGRSVELDRVDAAEAAVVLDNRDALLDPQVAGNLATWGMPYRLRALAGGTARTIFSGVVDAIRVRTDAYPDASVEISGRDGMAQVSQAAWTTRLLASQFTSLYVGGGAERIIPGPSGASTATTTTYLLAQTYGTVGARVVLTSGTVGAWFEAPLNAFVDGSSDPGYLPYGFSGVLTPGSGGTAGTPRGWFGSADYRGTSVIAAGPSYEGTASFEVYPGEMTAYERTRMVCRALSIPFDATGSTASMNVAAVAGTPNALDHLYQVAEAAAGRLWWHPDNGLRIDGYETRQAGLLGTAATFGTAAGQIGYRGIDPAVDGTYLFNDWSVVDGYGATHRTQDSTSAALYLQRSSSKETAAGDSAGTPSRMDAYSGYLAARYGTPTTRVPSLEVVPGAGGSATDWATVLSLFADPRLVVVNRPVVGAGSVSGTVTVEGWQTTWQPTNLTVRLDLAPADVRLWRLDEGLLDSTTRLGF